MNKTAIKNFAIWARNKLIADISYRAGLMGITPNGIHPALPQSTGQTKFYDIGTAEPYAISGEAIRQREHLAELIRRKAEVSGYQTAFKYIIEEVAYTWFNRLIAMRFMEVNDYLPSHIRVLSSDQGKIEPDLVTTPFDADLDFSRDEQQTIIDLKNENKLDEVFRLLFIKQCNALNEILPALFEKTNDYTELLQNLSVVDQDGVVYHLVHDIPEEDFDVERGGQVEIIGWLYQYYNTEPKNAAFAKKGKITKEEIPAVTQLFTPDWIVRYMVENSLGRLWIERNNAQQDYDIGHWEDNNILKSQWKYYLEEAIQELEINERLDEIRKLYRQLNVKDIKIIDPCMGSGHILVYAFDVLMQIYETVGYSQRDAAKTILENNLYGLDIDDRAFQMAYFAVMMKAREYNRRILNGKNRPNLYSIQESNDIDRKQLKFFGRGMEKGEREAALRDMTELFDIFVDAKEYGSILRVKMYDWERLERFATDFENKGQISLESVGLEETSCAMIQMIEQGKCLAQKYEICATNPPYRALSDCSNKLIEYVKKEFPEGKSDLFAVFIIKCRNMTKAHGFYSMITMQSWMFLSSFQTIRKRILENQITSMVHLGSHAFNNDVGTIVQTTAFCIRKSQLNNYIAHYKRLLSAGSSEQKERDFFNRDIKDYFAKNSIYLNIPGEPIVYWCSSDIANLFASNKPLKNLGLFDCGIKTGNNEWFLRGWFEVNYTSVALEPTIEQMESGEYKWFFYNKGGGYCKWYGNTSYVVDLEKDASRIKSLIDASTYRLRNKQNYFVEKLSWPLTGSDRFSCKYIGKRVLADVASNTINIDHLRNWTGLMAYMNSSLYNYMLNMINPTLSYPIESVIAIPLIEVQDEHIDEIVLENIEITKNDWDSKETSWDFKTHPLIDKGLIKDVWQKWNDLCNLRKQQIKNNEEYINASFAKIVDTNVEIEVEEKDILIHQASMSKDIISLLSYAVGCMFGRYALDINGIAYAGGVWESGKYTSFFPDSDNVIPITDEEYLEDDIVSRLCEWLKVVYGKETLEENLDFIAKALGKKGSSSREIIRNYFLTDFFKDHCQTYSVTGSGKRPIYWLFDSGKQNGFKALIYLHRYNADTIGNLRIDYLHRMQRIYESEIARMQDMIDNSTNNREVAQATKRREKLTKQLKECREYDEKLAHLALSRIELDLDDGVKVNYRKLQTANDGKFYEVLADSKNIMAKK